jgi:C1A family cysteine protease/predicted secreted protein
MSWIIGLALLILATLLSPGSCDAVEVKAAAASQTPFVWHVEFPGKIAGTATAADAAGVEREIAAALKDSGVTTTVMTSEAGVSRVRICGNGGLQQLREVLFGDAAAQAGIVKGGMVLKITGNARYKGRTTITLDANPSTGYGWEFAGSDGDAVLQEGPPVFEQTSPLVGAPGKQKVVLTGRGDGNTTVTLTYRRPWEKGAEPATAVGIETVDLPDGIDLSRSEAVQAPPATLRTLLSSNAPVLPLAGLPSAWDWRSQVPGGLTSIRDQGSCGSCWAFATVGVLESALKIQKNLATDLSEQFLVNCNNDGYSCAGGWFVHDYHQDEIADMQDIPGAVVEADMPYVGNDRWTGASCRKITLHPYRQTHWNYVAGYEGATPSVDQLKSAIYTHGPVGVALCVGWYFHRYEGGVFESDNCSGINHAVLLVGWDDATGSWILRNSWGPNWGENGYMRIKWGISNVGYGANYISGPYMQNGYELTVTKSGNGLGIVTSDPPGINCGATCSLAFQEPASVTLAAAPNSGSYFTGWYGCNSQSGLTCTVLVDGLKSVTASFGADYTLSVSKYGTGTGTVTSSPAGIDCGLACLAPFAPKTSITLTASPAANSVFTGWSGGCSGTGTSCGVIITANTSVAATFLSCNYTMSATERTFSAAGGSYTVTVTSNKSCPAPQVVTPPDEDWISQVTTWNARTGKGSVKLTAKKNLSSLPRSGTVSIGGQSFTATQAGATCSFVKFDPLRSLLLSAVGESGQLLVLVRPEDCTWTAKAGKEWITINPPGLGTNNEIVSYGVAANSDGKPRTGAITVILDQAPQRKKTFTVKQAK